MTAQLWVWPLQRFPLPLTRFISFCPLPLINVHFNSLAASFSGGITTRLASTVFRVSRSCLCWVWCFWGEAESPHQAQHWRESRKLGFRGEATTRATKRIEIDKNNKKGENANGKASGCSRNSKLNSCLISSFGQICLTGVFQLPCTAGASRYFLFLLQHGSKSQHSASCSWTVAFNTPFIHSFIHLFMTSKWKSSICKGPQGRSWNRRFSREARPEGNVALSRSTKKSTWHD